MVVYSSCVNKVDLSLPFSSITQKDKTLELCSGLLGITASLCCAGLKPHFGQLIFKNLIYLKFKFIVVTLA